MEGLTYKYYRKNKSKNIYLIIHGGGPVGVETDFISAIFDTISKTNNSALCFNFPYCERREENSSGPDLLEEVCQHSNKSLILFTQKDIAISRLSPNHSAGLSLVIILQNTQTNP